MAKKRQLEGWGLPGCHDNSPAFQGWVNRHAEGKSPEGTTGNVVAVRKDLSSLTGLEDLADENPRLKPWAIFLNCLHEERPSSPARTNPGLMDGIPPGFRFHRLFVFGMLRSNESDSVPKLWAKQNF